MTGCVQSLEPPHAHVETVVEILMTADLSPAALAALETAAVRLGPKALPAPLTLPLPQHGNSTLFSYSISYGERHIHCEKGRLQGDDNPCKL